MIALAQGDGNPGINRLARALDNKMKEYREEALGDIKIDFGVIQNDWRLLTNSFPVPIPKKGYRILKQLGEIKLKSTGAGEGSHTHDVKLPALKRGDHVLVVWVQKDPVVVGVIVSAEKLDGGWEYG